MGRGLRGLDHSPSLVGGSVSDRCKLLITSPMPPPPYLQMKNLRHSKRPLPGVTEPITEFNLESQAPHPLGVWTELTEPTLCLVGPGHLQLLLLGLLSPAVLEYPGCPAEWIGMRSL